MQIIINTDNKFIQATLIRLLKTMSIDINGVKKEKKNDFSNYPLAGSVSCYNDPFGPAIENEDWEVLK